MATASSSSCCWLHRPCCSQFLRASSSIIIHTKAGKQEAGARLSVRCSSSSSERVGFLGRLGRVIKEKAKSDVERLFSGFSKTRENLAVVDELLTYWNLSDSEQILDELEEALLVSDFGPRTALKIVDSVRKEVLAGKLTSGIDIKASLKKNIVTLLTQKVSSSELQLGTRRPAVIMIVGVNGGGKTTTLGKLAHRLRKEDIKVIMAAGDTFRAAATEQLDVWAKRTGSEIVVAGKDNARPASVISQAVRRALDKDFDVVLADTSGRLHTNYNLMEELRACKRAVTKIIASAPNEVLMVLDGTTGLNMLPQAREFNEVVGVSGFVLTKLDGTARGGCVMKRKNSINRMPKFSIKRNQSLLQNKAVRNSQ
ncbi:hypothetical protein O6H91_14G065900 [Diphasiastrum complanatum]|uniref:Uncharacterized protein n=1 Tax=Diphasiastrum complanatum TaxID=34168 RepID=A0ACC2BQ72_DIPCM|nr:hypothetical protein O6H91_14G065900 [Diphasiastrum complanatum]